MKRLFFIGALMLILSVSAHSQELKHFFQKYGKDDRFEFVTVNKSLFTLGIMFSSDMSDDEKDMLKGIEQVKILNSKQGIEKKQSDLIMKDLKKVIDNGDFESVVEVRDKGEHLYIYTQTGRKKKGDFLLVTNDNESLNLIWIEGKISRKIAEMIEKELVDL